MLEIFLRIFTRSMRPVMAIHNSSIIGCRLTNKLNLSYDRNKVSSSLNFPRIICLPLPQYLRLPHPTLPHASVSGTSFHSLFVATDLLQNQWELGNLRDYLKKDPWQVWRDINISNKGKKTY